MLKENVILWTLSFAGIKFCVFDNKILYIECYLLLMFNFTSVITFVMI